MKIKLFFLFMLFIHQTNLLAQEVWFESSRGITNDYQRYINSGNILGEFYVSPVIEDYEIENDSIILKGYVHYVFKRIEDIDIALLKKAKRRTICEILCKQKVYDLVEYIGVTDAIGNFEVKVNKKDNYLLFRDIQRKEYIILFFELKEQK